MTARSRSVWLLLALVARAGGWRLGARKMHIVRGSHLAARVCVFPPVALAVRLRVRSDKERRRAVARVDVDERRGGDDGRRRWVRAADERMRVLVGILDVLMPVTRAAARKRDHGGARVERDRVARHEELCEVEQEVVEGCGPKGLSEARELQFEPPRRHGEVARCDAFGRPARPRVAR